MTSDELQKLQELRQIQMQIYELNRKAEAILSSMRPKVKPSKPITNYRGFLSNNSKRKGQLK